MTPRDQQAEQDRRQTQEYINVRILAAEDHTRSTDERQMRLAADREHEPT